MGRWDGRVRDTYRERKDNDAQSSVWNPSRGEECRYRAPVSLVSEEGIPLEDLGRKLLKLREVGGFCVE